MTHLHNYFCSFFSRITNTAVNKILNISFLKMTSVPSEQMVVLNERLNKAESQLKLLTHEISEIKSQMFQLQKNSISSRHFSTMNIDSSENTCSPPTKKVKTEFMYEDGYVIVYTDGACENNGYATAKAGIGVWFGDNNSLNVSAPVKGKATNNVGEIHACIEAIKIALKNDVKKLCIKTDSKFVINSMTSWIYKWKKNNWTLSTGGNVKNKADFEILDKLCQQLESIRWVHVDGHKGIKGNEEADKLAKSGALLYKK